MNIFDRVGSYFDRKRIEKILEIMRGSGAAGETQSSDWEDALFFLNNKKRLKTVEGVPDLREYDVVSIDFDGVLCDSISTLYEGTLGLINEFGNSDLHLPVTMDDARHTYHAPYQDYFKRFGVDLSTEAARATFFLYFSDTIWPKLTQKYGVPKLFSDAVIFLEKLKKMKRENLKLQVNLVTAAPESGVMEVMQGLGLLELFDSVHFDQQDKTEVLKTLSGNGKKKSLMVGALPSDVKQARAANTDSLYITRTSPERDRAKYFLPNYISDKLVD